MWSTGVATLGGRIQVGDFTTLDIFKCCTRAVESEVHTDARVSRQEGRKYGQFEDREREREVKKREGKVRGQSLYVRSDMYATLQH